MSCVLCLLVVVLLFVGLFVVWCLSFVLVRDLLCLFMCVCVVLLLLLFLFCLCLCLSSVFFELELLFVLHMMYLFCLV